MIDKNNSRRVIILVVSLFVIILFSGTFLKVIFNLYISTTILILFSALSIYILKNLFKLININKKTISKNAEFSIIILFLINLIIFYNPVVTSNWFYIKHSILFILISILLIYFGNLIFHKFNKTHNLSVKKKYILQNFTLVMIVVALALISQAQLYVIKNYLIPPLYGCSYYDEYNHLIYNSQFKGTCPELLYLKHTDSTLAFTVKEEALRVKSNCYKEKYVINTRINYQYDVNNQVIYYQLIQTNLLYYQETYENAFSLYTEDKYTKTIDNKYDDNLLTSTLTNHYMKTWFNGRVAEKRNSQVVISELTKVNNSKYTIKISTKSDNRLTTLNEVDVLKDNYNIEYGININETEDYIYINHSLIRDNISQRYKTQAFGSLISVRHDVYYNHVFDKQNIPLYSHNNEDELHTEVRTNNTFVVAYSDKNIPFISKYNKTKYGYVFKHYNNRRGFFEKYENYKVFQDNVDFKNNSLSLELTSINDYLTPLQTLPDANGMQEFVYQMNPLLFGEELLK